MDIPLDVITPSHWGFSMSKFGRRGSEGY